MKNRSEKIFQQIENVRKNNNKNWMAILKLAYSTRPKETVKILDQILKKDSKLISLAKKLKTNV